jgi:cyclopropane fatty-acyl-phospholipid synthase-like methyltransferase
MEAPWLARIDRFEAMIASIGDARLARAAFQPGEHVLDLGCGGGKTSLASAGVCSVSDCLGLADTIAVNGAR